MSQANRLPPPWGTMLDRERADFFATLDALKTIL